MPNGQSLQDHYAPKSICFGCGPANEHGLHIKSFPRGDECVCTITMDERYHAFGGVLNGGMVGTLLDCHCNWTSAWALMRAAGDDDVPSTVTADYEIALKRPTPTGVPLHMTARVVEVSPPRAIVEGEIEANGKITATFRGTFVAVNPGHPAYHRW